MAGLPRALPGSILLPAVGAAVAGACLEEWQASPPGRWLAAGPKPAGFAMQPRDFRPADPEAGRRILAGAVVLGGVTLPIGVRGDPWDRPSPTRGFAVELHRFAWLKDLVAAEDGPAEALRLYLDWRRLFGRWNGFAWSPQVLERRVFNLACQARPISLRASDAETALMAADLARQARTLLALGGGPARAAERAAAAAVAGTALEGKAGERLLGQALRALEAALPQTVGPDGGHASRKPQAALELMFDLRTLEDALVERGRAAPEAVLRALDQLAPAVRFFTLADGGLVSLQGGQPLSPAYVAAARAQDELGDRPVPTARNGYQRLDGRRLQAVADAADPAAGPWSEAARAQPLGLEVLANGRRLIGAGAGRGIEDGSTVAMEEHGIGQVLQGFAAGALGPRLVGADSDVTAERHEAPGALWLELCHEGWMRRYGVRHQRRLYLDVAADELRGEDRLTPTAKVQGPDGRHFVPYTVRFHLSPGVSALVSNDRRSVLLRPEGDAAGWQFRNDALDVAIEPSVHASGRPSQQIVLRGARRADSGARVRWKLSPATARVDGGGSAT